MPPARQRQNNERPGNGVGGVAQPLPRGGLADGGAGRVSPDGASWFGLRVTFGSFARTRTQANQERAPFYSLPEGDFNAHAGAAARQWTLSIASGTSVSLTDTVRSDAVAAYRAVPLAAP